MSSRRRFPVWLAMAGFVASMGVVLMVAVFPACQRLAAPLVCPQGTVRSVVVVTWTNVQPGEHTMTSDLVCIDGRDRPERVRDAMVLAVIFGGWFLAAAAVSLLLRARVGRRVS